MEDTFWSLEDFPTRLVYPADHPDGVTYVVEVFGVVSIHPRGELVAYRLEAYQISKMVGEVQLTPIEEFKEAFKNYKREEK